MSALSGIRIVELAEDVSGEYCGKLLSDFGAEVIKVERRAGGSPTRAIGPMVRSEDGAQTSGLFAYLNTNKKSVALDLAEAADLALLNQLIASADAVIDDHAEGWLEALGLGPEDVEGRHPSVVFCSITPFGRGAPKDWDKAKSLTVFNAAGWGYHTPTAADPGKPPLKGAGRFIADYEAGLEAATCLAASLVWRGGSGKGQFIDVSQREVLLSRADTVVGRLLAGDDEPSSSRHAYDQRGPAKAYDAQDGYVYLYMTSQKHWAGLCELMGSPPWLMEFPANWLEFGVTEERVATFRAGFADWVRRHKKHEVAEAAQKLGVPLVPVNDASDLHRSPQYAHRGFFQALSHPVLGEALYPTVGYKLSATPVTLATPAPALDQHGPAIRSAGE
jgi:crotonobetainyl-CoA:carnitine CoA-transferase CaiB-like acyl-CoA transferase